MSVKFQFQRNSDNELMTQHQMNRLICNAFDVVEDEESFCQQFDMMVCIGIVACKDGSWSDVRLQKVLIHMNDVEKWKNIATRFLSDEYTFMCWR